MDYKQIGAYALIIKDEKILLINKVSGPYDGKLDLPGGTIEFKETPQDALIRELKEETGIKLKKYELFDADSVFFEWKYDKKIIKVHHIGIFYKVLEYTGKIKENIDIDSKNDDSKGAKFYKINEIKKEELSKIAILVLEKLGYN